MKKDSVAHLSDQLMTITGETPKYLFMIIGVMTEYEFG